MNLLCIDPGPIKSGFVLYDGEKVVQCSSEIDNETLLDSVKRTIAAHHLAIEMVASYGMAVGKDVFETCVWIGRFIQAFPGSHTCVYRRDVKLALCDSMRAKDTNIRQAILDLFPATGGGKTPQIGTKKEPGPLYGVSKHAWAALAVGITYFMREGE